MEAAEIQLLIDAGEGLRLEFKERLNPVNGKDICKEVAAFAATEGGILLIGVDDNQNVVGLIDPPLVKSKIEGWVSALVVPIPAIDFEQAELNGKEILLVHVERGKSPLYSFEDKFYGRVGTSSAPLKSSEIQTILRGVTIEQSLSALQSSVAAAHSVASSAAYAVAPAIFGQGELATKNYQEVRDRIVAELMASPAMLALQSSIAIANSMAAAAMHNTAPAIQGQSELATMPYEVLTSRLASDPVIRSLMLPLESIALSAQSTAALALSIAQQTQRDIQTLKASLQSALSA